MKLRSVVIPVPPKQYPSVVVEDEDDKGNPLPPITVYYDITDRGIVIKRIEGEDIKSDDLRGLRIAELRSAIRRMLVDDPSRVGGLAFLGRHGTADSPGQEALLQRAYELAAEATELLHHATPKRGRSAQNDDFYRAHALQYLRLYPIHGQRTSKALAAELGADLQRVYRWTQRARERGWLAGAQQGRAGAELGPRLLHWLREQDEQG